MRPTLNLKHSSIRFKLIILMLVISVIPLLIATFLSISYFSTTTEKENYDAQKKITSIFNQFETIPGTKWKLIVSVPENEVLQSVVHSRNQSIIIVAVVTVLTIIIAVFISRYISNIMLTITAFMKKVAEVNLTERLKVDSRDEIGQLKESTNIMLDAFSATVNNINESITGVATANEQLREATERSSTLSLDIGRTIQEMAEGTATQLSASEQTAMASEEMTNGPAYQLTTFRV